MDKRGGSHMKDFLGIFLLCLIASYLLVVFASAGGGWGLIVGTALVLAVLISAFLGQAKRIDELEQRLKALEEAPKPENE